MVPGSRRGGRVVSKAAAVLSVANNLVAARIRSSKDLVSRAEEDSRGLRGVFTRQFGVEGAVFIGTSVMGKEAD